MLLLIAKRYELWERVLYTPFLRGSVSSSSALQIFQGASHLWWLLCPTVYLLSHFLWLWHLQGNTSTGVFKGGCPTLTSDSLGFTAYFLILIASSLNQCKEDGTCGLTATSQGNPEDNILCVRLLPFSLLSGWLDLIGSVLSLWLVIGQCPLLAPSVPVLKWFEDACVCVFLCIALA